MTGRHSGQDVRPVIPSLIWDLVHRKAHFHGQMTQNRALVHKNTGFHGQSN